MWVILAFGAHTWLDNSYSSAPYPFFLSPLTSPHPFSPLSSRLAPPTSYRSLAFYQVLNCPVLSQQPRV